MNIPGSRMLKTAIAVFLTAFICELINWPPVFAVITAIVTLEPTVSDSIKKGIIRFPASAIGSFYAVLFIALFGNSPITYTLAAFLTIITCYHLKLHAGLLVATITAVAMIEVTSDHYFIAFLTRLGTTTIGISVSTLVNLFILPPNFMKDIHNNINITYKKMGRTLIKMVQGSTSSKEQAIAANMVEEIYEDITETEQFLQFQISELQYQRPFENEQKEIVKAKRIIEQFRLIHYHMGNLQEVRLADTSFTEANKQFILLAVEDLANYMTFKKDVFPIQHEQKLRNLIETYWSESQLPRKEEVLQLPNELTLLYELISIFYLINELEQTTFKK